MGKAIRIHLAKDSKTTFCGITSNKGISIAKKGENFFELDNNPIQFNCLCKNCVSLFAKNPIYNCYINKVKDNEKILEYEKKLPKTLRSMQYYRRKHQLNWNKKNTNPIEKLQAKSNIIETIDMGKGLSNSLLPIEKEETVNPIAIGEKSDKGKLRELRKNGLLPNSIKFNQIPETIDRIEDGHPIAIVKGFNNAWKVIEEFTAINNPNNSCIKELTGWVDIQLARKIYNQAIINRIF